MWTVENGWELWESHKLCFVSYFYFTGKQSRTFLHSDLRNAARPEGTANKQNSLFYLTIGCRACRACPSVHMKMDRMVCRYISPDPSRKLVGLHNEDHSFRMNAVFTRMQRYKIRKVFKEQIDGEGINRHELLPAPNNNTGIDAELTQSRLHMYKGWLRSIFCFHPMRLSNLGHAQRRSRISHKY